MDNPETWLAFTDLVMIDPVGTGWSRPAKPDGGSAFWSVRRDAELLAKVIALYVTKNGASFAESFGESYGGFRAAKVARALQNDQGIVPSGILMVLPMLEGAFQFGGESFALRRRVGIAVVGSDGTRRKGTFSAAAWRKPTFCADRLSAALAGPPLRGDAAHAFYARVAQITGLPRRRRRPRRGFIRDDFMKNLPGGDHKIVSHYDATFAVDDPNPESAAAHGPDPFLDGFIRAYGSAFVAYARDELGFKTEMTYNLLASEISGRWDWAKAAATGSRARPKICGIAVAQSRPSGYDRSRLQRPGHAVFELALRAQPYAAESDGERAELRLYRGGHMFYVDAQSRKAFTADARTMYASP